MAHDDHDDAFLTRRAVIGAGLSAIGMAAALGSESAASVTPSTAAALERGQRQSRRIVQQGAVRRPRLRSGSVKMPEESQGNGARKRTRAGSVLTARNVGMELRRSMFEEPIRFFVDVVQNDRSVLEFLEGKTLPAVAILEQRAAS